MKITPKLLRLLGFKYISSPFKDNLSHEDNLNLLTRWEKIDLSINITLVCQDKKTWLYLGNSGLGVIQTFEDMMSHLYTHGVTQGIKKAKNELRDWIGHAP